MEKSFKIVKTIVITLIIILLSIIAFLGVYSKSNNVWKNIVPEFNYGIEFNGMNELRYVLDTTEEEKNVYIDSEGNILGEVKEETQTEGIELTEGETAKEETVENEEKPNYATEIRKIKANADEVKTIENFEKAKSIIQKRLENEDVYEYNIRLDSITGELIVEVPDNDESVSVAHSAVTTIGDFKIIDEQTGIILIDKSDIKNVTSGIYQEDTGYQATLQITFNKEGAEKLKTISNKYKEVVNDAGESKIEYVSATLDGQTLITTYFGEELANGVIQLPLGNPSTDSNEMNEILKEAKRIAWAINEEKLPIVYTLSSDNFMQSSITQESINVALIIFVVAICIVSIIFIIKFKLKGLIASILAVGYIAVLTILVRYTGVYITINSIIAFLGVVILNYVFISLVLLKSKDNNDKEKFLKVAKKYYIAIVPVCIIAIIFTFMSNVIISSIGMILFWGLLLQIAYNALTILKLDLI